MEFFRVHNWNPSAATPADNGHPLYLWPKQGAGRVDDPEHEYLVLYVSSKPAGAIAEAFGRFPEWTRDILEPPPGSSPGTRKALVRYGGEPAITDLDDPQVLLELGLRPSQVIARDYTTTQAWSRAIHNDGGSDGISWWSFYGAQWDSIGLWDRSSLEVAGEPEELTLDHPAVTEAAAAISRIIRR